MATLSTILKLLEPYILFSSLIHKNSQQEYQGVYLIDGIRAERTDVVHIGTCDQTERLLACGILPEPCVLISAGDTPALRNAAGQGATLITTALTLPELNNLLTRFFLECRQDPGKECLGPDKPSFQELAVRFLGEHPGSLEKLEQKLDKLPNKPKRFKRGIIIRPVSEEGQPLPVTARDLSRLYEAMRNLFPLDHTALLDSCVYVMTSDARPDSPITVTEHAAFSALLKKHQAYAIVSNPSQRLHGVRVLFRQCFRILPSAVALGLEENPDQRCLRFDRYSPYYIIQLCEQAAVHEMGDNDILYLCHPAVLTLTRYDRAYNNNLRDTLFTYLMHDRSISETSRKLFQHRNTTIYKINQIQEMVNDDLENPYTRHQLILSCMIIRYLERCQHVSIDLLPVDNRLLRRPSP